jgi:hypothetical protein
MVNPIRNRPAPVSPTPARKKAPKEIDVRVKRAIKKSQSKKQQAVGTHKITSQIAAQKAYLAAEKAAYAARHHAFEIRKAAVKAQKSAFLAQRAHMNQQLIAAKRARAAERAKKAAERAAKKALTLRKLAKIKAYIAQPEEKKRSKLLKKYIPSFLKKKKS